MTPLTKPVHRVANKKVGKRRVIVTLAPGTDARDDLIGLRLQGTRTQYVVRLSDIYRVAALWHGNKEAAARRQARKDGIPWHRARKNFLRANSIQYTAVLPVEEQA